MKDLNEFLSKYNRYTYEDIENRYKEFLDECFEPVELAGMTIYASDMISIDPVMFRCGVADFSSEEFEEHENEYYLKEDYENALDEHESQEE